jgi:uncharacterized tellurite resistance protein B-like protein
MTSRTRKNKDIAGYQILSLIAMLDGEFDPREGSVIVSYVEEHFPLGGNLESALEELSTTAKEDYPILLQQCAEDFYADSNEKERLSFIQFALKLMNADEIFDADENWALNNLYQYWDIQ